MTPPPIDLQRLRFALWAARRGDRVVFGLTWLVVAVCVAAFYLPLLYLLALPILSIQCYLTGYTHAARLFIRRTPICRPGVTVSHEEEA